MVAQLPFNCRTILQRWQELIAGLISAAAVTATVWWTLSAEKRRRAEETRNMRVALGSELRQFMTQTLTVLWDALDAVSRSGPGANAVSFSYAQLGNMGRFPDAVVYRGSIGMLSSLGERAFKIGHFYGQIQIVRDDMTHMREMSSLGQAARRRPQFRRSRESIGRLLRRFGALPFGRSQFGDARRAAVVSLSGAHCAPIPARAA